MGGIIREEEIILTTEGTLIMEDTLTMEDTQIMVDSQTTMDTLIMEGIPIMGAIQVTMLIVGNCNPSLVEVDHLGLMMTAILRLPLKGDNNIHFRTFVMNFNSTQMC